jgi:uncharacterized delta-60 repeat protein
MESRFSNRIRLGILMVYFTGVLLTVVIEHLAPSSIVPVKAAYQAINSTRTGTVIANFNLGTSAGAVVLQSDGKIIVAGRAYDATSNNDFGLARYDTDGSLDTSFGTDGLVTTDFWKPGNANDDDCINAGAVQSDGKIVVAGYAYNASNNTDFALARYNTNGSLDASFGTAGLVMTDITGSNERAHAIVMQTDGKIVAAGVTEQGGEKLALARYNTNGSPDTSFDSDGVVTATIGSYSRLYAVAIQTDGKIVAAGSSSGHFVLVRYNTDGSPDTSFGNSGVVTTTIGSFSDAYALVIQTNGKIVAAGETAHDASTLSSGFALVRYDTDGSLDTSFGTNGIVTSSLGSSYNGAYAVALQSDGKMVAAGYTGEGVDDDFALARYNTDGSLDGTFGTGGAITTDFGNREPAHALAIQTDGKVVLAGYTQDVERDFALARYNADGSPDTSFGFFAIFTPLIIRQE